MDLHRAAFQPPPLPDLLDRLTHLLRSAADGDCTVSGEFWQLHEQLGDDLHEGANRGEDAADHPQVMKSKIIYY